MHDGPPRGTLPDSALSGLISAGQVSSDAGLEAHQVQPASIDLTLAAEAYRMPGSTLSLPGERVRELVEGLALERLSLTGGVTLARGQVYWVRLRERLSLPPTLEAYANSKSSTGRIDLATRVLADGCPRYDRVPLGYQGELWVELIPRSFDVVARSGDSLNQIIVFHDRQVLTQRELAAVHATTPLLRDAAGLAVDPSRCLVDGRVIMTADLDRDIVGWVARRSFRPVQLTGLAAHDPASFFAPIPRPASGRLFLEKDRFYILATRERVVVPTDLACEMVPYDPAAGEFRAHYAGFFDPGWGVAADGSLPGARAVLEVRPHEDDLILRDGQPICAMAYERLSGPCQRPYGGSGSNYAGQDGPRLSKHFR